MSEAPAGLIRADLVSVYQAGRASLPGLLLAHLIWVCLLLSGWIWQDESV